MSSNTGTLTRTRRTFLTVTGVIGGAVLALTVPAMAGAHVVVSPDEIVAGEHGVLTFSFSHGCDHSPTTALHITMPKGLSSVAPTMDGDWSIEVERGDDGLVSAVTYTALAPVPNELRGAVSMSVGLDEKTPDTLAFPVVQECIDGATEWTQIAKEGEDPHSLDAPAPVVTIAAAATDGHSAHGAAETTDETPATSTTVHPAGIAVGAGGLVAGLAALVVSVLAYRRRA